MSNQTGRQETPTVFQTGPLIGAVPGVAINTGRKGRLIMIRAPQLSKQLYALMSAGIRRVVLLLAVEGQVLLARGSIVSRGPAQPPFIHPLNEAERFLAEIYMRRREAMGARRGGIPVLILNLMPLAEGGSTPADKQESGGGP
jgi:hypothetical protein